MYNYMSYIKKYGDKSFQEMNFNEVDSLILSNVAYLPFFDTMGSSLKAHTKLKFVLERVLKIPNLKNLVLFDKDINFMKLIKETKRFGEISIFGYHNVISNSKQEQFSGLGIQISESLIYVGFCGTDISWAGWKENFNMTFLEEIPAQKDACIYFQKLGKYFKDSKFILAGHSKGGNLAMYAGAFVDKEIQDRIVSIYNFDGPGFRKDITEKEGYKLIEPRIRSIVPESSIVGMILEHSDKVEVIKAQRIGIFQHDLHGWVIDDIKFYKLKSLSKNSKAIHSAIREWMLSISKEDRKLFVNTIFKLIVVTRVLTTKELLRHKLKYSFIMYKTYLRMNKKEKKILKTSMKLFKSSLKKAKIELLKS